MNKKIALAMLICLSMLMLFSCKGKADSASEKVPVQTKKVISVKEEGVVRVIGNIQAERNSWLFFLSDGKIKNLYVNQGDRVKRGDVLAELETARDEFKIQQKKDEWEKEKFSGSPRRAAALQQEILALEEDLEKKMITAPFDGMVGKVKGVAGENYNFTSTGNDKGLINLIDRRRMKALVNIPERDIPRVSEGQSVLFHFDAVPGEVFQGSVFSLSPAGRVVNGYAQMETELIIENPDPRIYPGYSLTAEIHVSEARDILVLDRDAVEWEDDKILVTVADISGEAKERREIQAEILDQNRLRIISGLNEGDRVILPLTKTENDGSMMFY